MGETSKRENVRTFLSALGQILNGTDWKVDTDAAVATDAKYR